MLSWAWRHRKKIAVTAVMGGATAYGAYYLYRKKRELDELMEKFGLQQLLSGGTSNGGRSSCEERYSVPSRVSMCALQLMCPCRTSSSLPGFESILLTCSAKQTVC